MNREQNAKFGRDQLAPRGPRSPSSSPLFRPDTSLSHSLTHSLIHAFPPSLTQQNCTALSSFSSTDTSHTHILTLSHCFSRLQLPSPNLFRTDISVTLSVPHSHPSSLSPYLTNIYLLTHIILTFVSLTPSLTHTSLSLSASMHSLITYMSSSLTQPYTSFITPDYGSLILALFPHPLSLFSPFLIITNLSPPLSLPRP